MSKQTQDKQTQGKQRPKQKNMGEGNREADAQYRKDTRNFVESGKVKDAAKKAGKQDPKEAKEAEAKGKARAKEFDQAVHREYEKSE